MKQGKMLGSKLHRKNKVNDQMICIKMAWVTKDETAYHSFCLQKDVSSYVRMCILIYNKIMRSRPLTPEQEARLDAIGGWPSREEQEKRIEETRKNLLPGKKLGSNEWLNWDKLNKKESDLNASIKTTCTEEVRNESSDQAEEKIMVPVETKKGAS